MRWLRQSTAFTFRAGPFLDSTDGVTAETALTIAQADIQISKDGGAFAQTSDAAPTTTHDADGWYQCPLTATDTNTLGPLTVQIVMAGALPVWADFMVMPAWIYDMQVDGLGTEAGTAQAGAAGSITLAAAASATDDLYTGQVVAIISGTGAGQVRQISDYNGTTKVASVDPNWNTTPDATSVYVVLQAPPAPTSVVPGVNVVQISGDATAADNLEAAADGTGYNLGGGSVVAASVTGAVGSVTGNVGGNVAGSVGSVTGAVGSVTGNVGGNVVGSVGSVSGLDAAALQQIVDDLEDAGRLDLLIDAIKAKTDSLTFTQAGHVDSNVQRINDVALTGDGSATPFGV